VPQHAEPTPDAVRTAAALYLSFTVVLILSEFISASFDLGPQARMFLVHFIDCLDGTSPRKSNLAQFFLNVGYEFSAAHALATRVWSSLDCV
jgi:hypothetical protein